MSTGEERVLSLTTDPFSSQLACRLINKLPTPSPRLASQFLSTTVSAGEVHSGECANPCITQSKKPTQGLLYSPLCTSLADTVRSRVFTQRLGAFLINALTSKRYIPCICEEQKNGPNQESNQGPRPYSGSLLNSRV
jgi:hypothetical protein